MGARSSRRAPGAPTWTEGTGWCPLHAEGAVPAPLIEATELKLFRTHRKDPDLTARGQQAGWWVLPEAPMRTRGAPRGEEGVGGVPADEHLRTQFFRDKETAEKNRGVGGGGPRASLTARARVGVGRTLAGTEGTGRAVSFTWEVSGGSVTSLVGGQVTAGLRLSQSGLSPTVPPCAATQAQKELNRVVAEQALGAPQGPGQIEVWT